jgi:hypothetical protein
MEALNFKAATAQNKALRFALAHIPKILKRRRKSHSDASYLRIQRASAHGFFASLSAI